jgi:hypothetical protein
VEAIFSAGDKIVQASEPHAPMKPFSHIDPRWAIKQGLIGPHTLLPKVDPFVNDRFNLALNWRPPRDPLVLDLDGDGIEATAIDPQHPVLFDHDASGSRTATGWIAPDDGLLVLDLDGNGTIDTGRELFGDNTLLSDGVTLAANGFDALSRYDANVDHTVSALDPVWADLRIWQDINQDGISQPEELHTLAALGIQTITVTAEASSLNLCNGNTMPWRGSFTRTDGSQGDSGTPELSGSLLLAANNFYRTFTDDPAPTPEALALPEMRGSGEVRDLRAAMSLGTDAGLSQIRPDASRRSVLKKWEYFLPLPSAEWALIATKKRLVCGSRCRRIRQFWGNGDMAMEAASLRDRYFAIAG